MKSVRCLSAFASSSNDNRPSFILTLSLIAVVVFTAVPATAQSAKVYWTEFGATKVQRANLDGSSVEDIVTGAMQPFEIDVDGPNSKMYWTETVDSKIQRADLDGSNIIDVVTGLDTPRGLAIDEVNGKIYWTDWGTAKIQRANLDGSSVEDIVTTGLSTPRGIVLDVAGGKIYWTDSGTNKIQRSNLDGTSPEDLITSGLGTVVGIDLDVAGGKMYWIDQTTATVHRANLDGSSAATIIGSGLVDPSYINVDETAGKIFWTDFGSSWVQSANLDGSSVTNVVTAGLLIPTGIALAPSAALPVELTSIETLVDGDKVTLTWSTASETNFSGFEVQQQEAGGWNDKAFVLAVGSESEGSDYSVVFTDLEPGIHKFRLRQIDFDGSFEYSAIVEASIDLPSTHVVSAAYPNPFTTELTLRIGTGQSESVYVSLHDIQGKMVSSVAMSLQAGQLEDVTVDGSELAAGVYILTARGETFASSQRVVLVK